MIARESSPTSRTESEGAPSCISKAPRKLASRRKIWSSRLAPTMKPSPPTWIKIRITSWPNQFQWVPVSTVTSPVTAEAETATKRASTGSDRWPSAVVQGEASRSAPRAIITASTTTKTWACRRTLGDARPLRLLGQDHYLRLANPAPDDGIVRPPWGGSHGMNSGVRALPTKASISISGPTTISSSPACTRSS